MENEKRSAQYLINMASLSKRELDAELEMGYADMLNGRVKPADMVFKNICKDFSFGKVKF